MELIIYAPKEDGFIKSIDWNFEELKAEITKKVEPYTNLVLTDDQIKDGKKDVANLRKLQKALEDKRKEIREQILIPYDKFEEQEKVLVAVVQEAVDNIVAQIKGVEDAQREEKEELCRELYKKHIRDLDRTVPFEKVFNPRWLNKTYTEKQIIEDIETLRDKADRDLKMIIKESSAFAYEMKEEYLKDFDLSAAMAVKQRLEETEKKKAIFEEQERQRIAEEEKRIAAQAHAVQSAGNAAAPVIGVDENGDPAITTEDKADKIIMVTFRVTAKQPQFPALNDAIKMLKANSESVEMLERKEI